MNILNRSILAAILSLSVLYVSAATTLDNKDDGSAIGTSDTPQIKEQMKATDQETNKSTPKKNQLDKSSKKMKMMDTNNDGVVTRDEFMASHEKAYENMNPSSDGIKY